MARAHTCPECRGSGQRFFSSTGTQVICPVCDGTGQEDGPTDPEYLIWSNEHAAWWGPGNRGYTKRVSEAGCYTHTEALRICASAMRGTADRLGVLPEIPVRLADVRALQTAYHALYPALPLGRWE